MTTQCLYPSFEPVDVYVVKFGDGFRVHDASGAFRSAWLHGRDERLIHKMIDAECRRFHASRLENSINIHVEDVSWLPSAILGVANASSFAAKSAVERIVASTEKSLVDVIEGKLLALFGSSRVVREVELTGKSGGRRRFDIVLDPNREDEIVFNAVAAHHVSISAKYVSFSDVDLPRESKFAVYKSLLDADDVALLQQVALIVPVESLKDTAFKAKSVFN